MSKTIGLTFVAAALLMAAAIATHNYGYHSVAAQMAVERELSELTRFYCSHCATALQSWERAASLMGLLSVSVTIAGAMLWNREIYLRAQRVSVLGLEMKARRRNIRVAATLNNPAIADAHTKENNEQSHEEENLTPLERVIQGY